MTSVNLYLDKRFKNANNQARLKVAINKYSSSAYINLEIWLEETQWDSIRQKIKNHPNRAMLQLFADNRKNVVINTIHRLTETGDLLGFTATQIKNRVLQEIDPKRRSENYFFNRFVAFGESRTAESTRSIYKSTAKRLLQYDRNIKTISFEQINKDWLTGFDRFLTKTAPSANARSIHMRNIRAVFNDAIDNDVTRNYPFRRFKIKSEPTAKRSLTVEQLRTLFAAKPSEEASIRALDYFKIIFFLIGINAADLFDLEKITADGRIDYRRKKTRAIYSIKVEPEALELIEKHRGKKKLLDIADFYKKTHTFTSALNHYLKGFGVGNISAYWARHTWATLAYELDIPNETIAAALGHSFGNKTTAIYIKKDERKIDEANRRVLDWVLYDKK